jgi:hypothetical protein
MASKPKCPRCKYACGSKWNYCPRCSYELVENPHPVKQKDNREKMTMTIAKLWVVCLEGSGDGIRMHVKRALEGQSMQTLDWIRPILLPPMRDEMLAPVPLDTIQQAVEEGGKIRIERYWPYGMGGK